MTEEKIDDLPRIMAAVMAAVPSLVLKTGWAYLMMKKRAQKASKMLERELVSSGIPAEYAGKLADQFASEVSIRKIIKTIDMPFGGARQEQSLEK